MAAIDARDEITPPTPAEQVRIMHDLAMSVQRAMIAARHLLWAVAILGAANITLVCAVIALLRRG